MKYFFALLFIIAFPAFAFAQNGNSNANANTNLNASDVVNINYSRIINLGTSIGINPESKWYFLEKWKEGIDLFFTFNKEKKVEKMLKFSERRLSEYGSLLDKGNADRAKLILEDYQNQIAKVQDYAAKIKSAKNGADDLSAKVSERIVKHQETLSRVYQKAPEPAKQALQKVLQKAEDKLPGFLERLINPDVYSGAINKAKTIKDKVKNTLTNEDFQGF